MACPVHGLLADDLPARRLPVSGGVRGPGRTHHGVLGGRCQLWQAHQVALPHVQDAVPRSCPFVDLVGLCAHNLPDRLARGSDREAFPLPEVQNLSGRF